MSGKFEGGGNKYLDRPIYKKRCAGGPNGLAQGNDV